MWPLLGSVYPFLHILVNKLKLQTLVLHGALAFRTGKWYRVKSI